MGECEGLMYCEREGETERYGSGRSSGATGAGENRKLGRKGQIEQGRIFLVEHPIVL